MTDELELAGGWGSEGGVDWSWQEAVGVREGWTGAGRRLGE